MVDSTSHFLKSGTFQKKNVILTGATGGIGSLVLKELLACGANVLALVRDPKLPSYLNDYTKTGQFNYEVIDLEVGPKFTSVMTSAMLKLKGKLDILDILVLDQVQDFVIIKNLWFMTITPVVSSNCVIACARRFSSKAAGSGHPHIICPMERYIRGKRMISDTRNRRKSPLVCFVA